MPEMRRTLSLALLVAVMAIGVPAAMAQTCSYDPSSYGTGGEPVEAAVVDDPLFPRQWGLDQINAPEAWAMGATGDGAVIAVVDTGVDLAHPDLAGQLMAGVDFHEANGGEADCPGPQDQWGHGTHVAGVAAAEANNGIGIAGVAPGASILPLKVGGVSPDGFTAPPVNKPAVAAAIRYAADAGADVINISISMDSSEQNAANTQVFEAAEYAWERGSVLVAAAGNGLGGTGFVPMPFCQYPGQESAVEAAPALRQDAPVACVGGTDSRSAPSYFSNFPVKTRGIALRAPAGGRPYPQHRNAPEDLRCENAEEIWSTDWPGFGPDCGAIEGYDATSGTSFAAPHVSGVAAMLAAEGLSNVEIMNCLRRTSTNRGAFDAVMGYGIVDAAAAVSGCTDLGRPGLSDLRYRVTLPDDYGTGERRYPVLYVLHGDGGNENTSVTQLGLQEFASTQDVIVVTPYGGSAFFRDWRDGSQRWEELYLEVLVPHIDATYRTIADRAYRSVAGTSMGGYGAMLWAAHRPDLFVAAASFSGVLDITRRGPGTQAVHLVIPPDNTKTRMWGDPVTDELGWHAGNPADLARNLGGVSIFHSVGTGVPVAEDLPAIPTAIALESFLRDQNDGFDQALDAAGIEHTYLVRDGVHHSRHWSRDLRTWWTTRGEEALGSAAPTSFDHRSAGPSFSAWGWSFTSDVRRAAEFLDVADASSAGVTLTGSGTTEVVTPPLFGTNQKVWLCVKDQEVRVRADGGRLTFEVDLGPANPLQEYTAERRALEAAGGGSSRTVSVQFGAGRTCDAGNRSG
jgi:subtilisin family serine protease